MKAHIFLFLAVSILNACSDDSDESRPDAAQLVGKWNAYEYGTEKDGFHRGPINSLTVAYESGITFREDGTFGPRYFINEVSSDDDVRLGTYELRDKIIVLTFHPGTPDETKLELDLVKLTENQLWFRHSLFLEREYHLERAEE